ncbi:MAG: AMP phosphorylase [Candidatus Bathyarchaeia archaeon]|nr:AMP phosphorylase [Candidatus Bathyarchaeota archaeon]
MKFKVKEVDLDAGGKLISVLNMDDAEELGIRSLSRIKIEYNNKEVTAIANITKKVVNKGEIGIFREVKEKLEVIEGETVNVSPAPLPKSLDYIKNRLKGRKLNKKEIKEIVMDVVEGRLSEVEIAAFITSLNFKCLDLEEAMNFSLAMVEAGKTLNLNKELIADKHSIGGIPGDKTTLLLVPIVASCGVTIPKSSSRAITSAAGTADRAEVLMPVNLNLNEMKEVVEKADGCIVWGGALDLSPADDIFINVEFPLSLDPLLLPSILSKKKAVGSKFVVIDIPCGWGAKVKTVEEANQLAKDFIELGEKLGMKIRCAITYGNQPIGYSIGPALEAKEALENLMRIKKSVDLIDKVTDLAGMILNMAGFANGKNLAIKAIETGKAERKLREIIELQGGKANIKIDDIPIGCYKIDLKANEKGYVTWIDNYGLVKIARYAGAPKHKGAGVQLYKKVGDPVRKGESLLSIYAEKSSRLEEAISILKEYKIINVGERIEMTISEIKEPETKIEEFILER